MWILGDFKAKQISKQIVTKKVVSEINKQFPNKQIVISAYFKNQVPFDSFEEAESFVLLFEEDIKEIEGDYGPIIKEGILYYDGGYCHYPEEVNLNV